MLLPHFLAFLVKSGLIFTGGLITFRAIASLRNPPLKLTPVVQTYDGPVQGKIGYSRNGTSYWQFLGIPFALPPVSSLRFQPPIPVKRWDNVKQVIQFPPACVQFDPVVRLQAMGQEDCLYLNVFVSNPVKTTAKKPVLVFIHGGGFFGGESSIYRPDYFLDYPIVLVTFNYRLGPFGFMNLQENDPKHRFPRGNMGLKDQRLAMEWVSRNIAQFGGDPKKVTLFGESAGAISTHLHLLSPLSEGLFQRAFMMSGSAYSPWGFSGNPRKVAKNYAWRVGCPTQNMTKLFECFMKFDAKQLVKHQMAWANPFHEKDLFLPSVEPEPYLTDEIFLRQSPEILGRSEGLRGSRVPLMIGVTSGEGGVRSARFQALPESIPTLDKNWNTLIGRVLLQDNPVMEPRIAQELRRVYFGNATRITGDMKEFMEKLTRMCSDVLFYEPVHNAAMDHSKFAPTYMFYFDYQSVMLPGSYSFYRSVRPQDRRVSEVKLLQGLFSDWTSEHVLGQTGIHKYGIGHGEDLFQFWNINGLSKWLSDGDLKFSRSFVKTIVDFSMGIEPLTFRGTPWPPVSSGVLPKSPGMVLPFMVMNNAPTGRLTEEPFYTNRVEVLNQLLARY